MSFKSATISPVWRRSTVFNVSLNNISPRPRVSSLLVTRALPSQTRRQNSGGGPSYFQTDSQKPRPVPGSPGTGNAAGPIYVLPGETKGQLSGSWIFGCVCGMFLATVVVLTMNSPALVAHKPDNERQNKNKPQHPILSRLGSSRSSDDGEDSSNYLEDDGTEEQRSTQTTKQELPSSEVLALEKDLVLQKLWNLRETNEKTEESAELRRLLESANIAQLKAHMALINFVTTSRSANTILDDALLRSRPMSLNDGTSVDASKASLIRVVDEHGKNKMLILGIDLDWHESNYAAASRFPSDCYELDFWLISLADELEQEGANARDLAIYLYSNRVILDLDHVSGNRWMTRYRKSDFPAGFPLAQMRQTKKVSQPSANLSNVAPKAAAPGRDREAS